MSYDSLFEDYNVRVARSDSITGPYVDYHGRDMKDSLHMPQYEVGVKIIGGYRFGEDPGWIAPGHNSVLNDEGTYFMVHHARGGAGKSWPYLHIRTILWTEDGRPVVSPERYAGETEQAITANLIPGSWEQIVHDPAIDGQISSSPLILLENGELAALHGAGRGFFDGQRTLSLLWSSIAQGEGRTSSCSFFPPGIGRTAGDPRVHRLE